MAVTPRAGAQDLVDAFRPCCTEPLMETTRLPPAFLFAGLRGLSIPPDLIQRIANWPFSHLLQL